MIILCLYMLGYSCNFCIYLKEAVLPDAQTWLIMISDY